MKILTTVLLAMLFATSVLALGGQDIQIDLTEVTSEVAVWDVAAATNGTLFAACHEDSDRSILNIYRSKNGGSTWTLWDQLESFSTDGRVHAASLATTSGNPGKLLVAWVDQRLSSPASWVRVSRASVADEVPSWSSNFPYLVFNLEVDKPSIDTIPIAGFQDRVCLAWENDGNVLFSSSVDSGVNWSNAVELFTGWSSQITYSLEVAADNNGVVHLAWLSVDFNADTKTFHYRRAQWGGELIGNWAPTVNLQSTVIDAGYGIALAADPSFGDGVVVVTDGSMLNDPPMRIYKSEDQGLTWEVSADLDFQASPTAAWGSSGPVIGAGTFGTMDMGSAWTLVTPLGWGWHAEVMISHPWDAHGWVKKPALALDPTRDDAPMLVGMRRLRGQDTYSMWFNATWRDAPGYGVPDPFEFYDTHAHNIPQPVLVGDLDGDDELEVVLVEEDGSGSLTVKFIEPTTGDLIHIDSGMSPLSNMALVNNNHGHEMDVFYVRASDGWLEGKNGDGTDKDGYPQDLGLGAGPYYISGGTILSETIEWVVVAAGRDVNVMNWDGDQWEGWPWTAPLVAGQINGRVAVGDVDFDGLGELVVPFTNRVAVLDAYGQVISQFGDGEAAAGSPSLADFDRDGDLEIVIPRADGTIHVVHHDGTPLTANWPYDTGAVGMPSQVALADIAGNDRRDLIFTDASHTVHVMTPAGILVQQWDLGVDPASPVVDPVVAQVGLGEPAVIVGGSDGRLRVHTLDGSQEGWPRDMPESILTAVTVADIDADGKVEMMVPTSENLWVLDMGVANNDSLSLWPMSGADSRRSGSVAADPAAVSAAPQMPASPLALHGPVPNPFNPATSIRFSLPESAPNVSLRVYDVAGRLVKTLHLGPLAEGDHQVLWRGDDTEGRTVASGVYYCRLEAAGHVRTRSMVLAR